jgi:hypothetical protein
VWHSLAALILNQLRGRQVGRAIHCVMRGSCQAGCSP